MHNPKVPETLEGWCVLHHMFRIRWDVLAKLTPAQRADLAAGALGPLSPPQPDSGYTAPVHLLGHKADLMIIHFRRNFEDLSRAQLDFQQTRLNDYFEMTTSYVSIVELGLYEMTAKIHQQLGARGLKNGSVDFDRAFGEELA